MIESLMMRRLTACATLLLGAVAMTSLARAIPLVQYADLGGINLVDDQDIVVTPDGSLALTLVGTNLAIVDTTSGTVQQVSLDSVNLVPGHDIVVTEDGSKALVLGGTTLHIVDLSTGTTSDVELSSANVVSDIDIVATPDSSKALILGAEVHVVDLASATVSSVSLPAVNLVPGQDIQITPDSGKALVASGTDIAIIDLATNDVQFANVGIGNLVADQDIVLTPDGATAVQFAGPDVAIIDVATGDVTIAATGIAPVVPGVDIRITPDGSEALYLTPTELVRVDLATGTFDTIALPAVNFVPDVDLMITPDGEKAVFTGATALNIVDLTSGTVTQAELGAVNLIPGIDVQITPDGTQALLPSGTDIAIVDLASGSVTKAALDVIQLQAGLDVLIAPDGGTAIINSGPLLSLVEGIPSNSALYLSGTDLAIIDLTTGAVEKVSLGIVGITPNIDMQITTRPAAFGVDDDIPLSTIVTDAAGGNGNGNGFPPKRGEVDQLTIIEFHFTEALLIGGTQLSERGKVEAIAITGTGGIQAAGGAFETMISTSPLANPAVVQSILGATATSVGDGEFASAAAGLLITATTDGQLVQRAFAQAEAIVFSEVKEKKFAEAHAVAMKEVVFTDWIIGEVFTLDYFLVQLALGLDPVGHLTTESVYRVHQETDIAGLESLWFLEISSVLDENGDFAAAVVFESNENISLNLTDQQIIDILLTSIRLDLQLGKLIFELENFLISSTFFVNVEQWTLTTTVAAWARAELASEPETALMFLAGLILLGVMWRRRNRSRSQAWV